MGQNQPILDLQEANASGLSQKSLKKKLISILRYQMHLGKSKAYFSEVEDFIQHWENTSENSLKPADNSLETIQAFNEIFKNFSSILERIVVKLMSEAEENEKHKEKKNG